MITCKAVKGLAFFISSFSVQFSIRFMVKSVINGFNLINLSNCPNNSTFKQFCQVIIFRDKRFIFYD